MSGTELLKPTYAHNMRLIGHSDQGGPLRRPADHGAATATPISAMSARRASRSSTCAIPTKSEDGQLHRRTRRTPGACTCRCTTTCCWSCTRHDMFPQAEMADERNYYKAEVGHARRPTCKRRRATGRPEWRYSIFQRPGRAAADRLHAGRRRGPAPHLVRRRAVGLCVRDDGRVSPTTSSITIDMADPTKPEIAGRYWLPGMNLAAGEEAALAARTRTLRAAPRRSSHGDIAYCAWRDGVPWRPSTSSDRTAIRN